MASAPHVSLKGLLPGESRTDEIKAGGTSPRLTIACDRPRAGTTIEFEAISVPLHLRQPMIWRSHPLSGIKQPQSRALFPDVFHVVGDVLDLRLEHLLERDQAPFAVHAGAQTRLLRAALEGSAAIWRRILSSRSSSARGHARGTPATP